MRLQKQFIECSKQKKLVMFFLHAFNKKYSLIEIFYSKEDNKF